MAFIKIITNNLKPNTMKNSRYNETVQHPETQETTNILIVSASYALGL